MNVQPTGEAPHSASSLILPETAAHEFLQRLKMPCRLLVAYSGGGDSTGLLVALHALAAGYPGLSLAAATVDHGLRVGSHEEAVQAGVLCKALDVPHRILTWQGDKPKTGIQAVAREARYRLLAEHAADEKIDLVVTAHNRDDQLETFAMRRARNPNAAGGISDAVLIGKRVWVCRPFLPVRRVEIRDYLRAREISWVEDPSNENATFERIRIRQALKTVDLDLSDDTNDRADIFHRAADYLRSHVILHSGLVAEVELGNFQRDDPAQDLAILSLAAFLGGRSHLAGRDSAERVFAFLADRSRARATAERVVFDRRGDRLFIAREVRGLPDITIPAHGAVLWDGRFHITNRGAAPARITPSSYKEGKAHEPLFVLENTTSLPKGVVQRASAVIPHLVSGEKNPLVIRPIIAQFEYFLPASRLEVANTLAFLAGLERFPSLSLG